MTDKETKTMDIVVYSLTKREHYASLSMAAQRSNDIRMLSLWNRLKFILGRGPVEYSIARSASVANNAIADADALIKALERGGE